MAGFAAVVGNIGFIVLAFVGGGILKNRRVYQRKNVRQRTSDQWQRTVGMSSLRQMKFLGV